MENIIALIFDFDITLSPKFQQEVIFEDWGMEADYFWGLAKKNLDNGYDLEHSYLKVFLDLANRDKKYRLSNHKLFEYGKRVELYEGLSKKDGQISIFDDLINILDKKEYRELNIKLECYCISGGIYEMIDASLKEHKIDKFFKEIFACKMAENKEGYIFFPKETVGHTIKTQKLYMIAKGAIPSLGATLSDVNKVSIKHRVPFSNMIFLGDGQTDIPAFSLLNAKGGTSIAVYREAIKDGKIDEMETLKSYENGYKLAIESQRAKQILPANYSKTKPLKLALMHNVEKIAKKIVNKDRNSNYY